MLSPRPLPSQSTPHTPPPLPSLPHPWRASLYLKMASRLLKPDSTIPNFTLSTQLPRSPPVYIQTRDPFQIQLCRHVWSVMSCKYFQLFTAVAQMFFPNQLNVCPRHYSGKVAPPRAPLLPVNVLLLVPASRTQQFLLVCDVRAPLPHHPPNPEALSACRSRAQPRRTAQLPALSCPSPYDCMTYSVICGYCKGPVCPSWSNNQRLSCSAGCSMLKMLLYTAPEHRM